MTIGERFLAARAEPDGDVGGFQGVVDDAGQVGADGVEVNGVLQADGEGGDGLVGVVPGPSMDSTLRRERSGNVTAGTAEGDAGAGTRVRSAL
jgi:hypothetical protein